MKNGLINLLAFAVTPRPHSSSPTFTKIELSISLLFLLFGTGTSVAADGYNLISLGNLGGISSSANALNDQGQVVGTAAMLDGSTHAFIWQTGIGMTDLGVLPGDISSRSVAINGQGCVAGLSNAEMSSQFTGWRSFITSPLGLQDTGVTGLSLSAINDANIAVGSISTPQSQYAVTYTVTNGVQLIAAPGMDLTLARKINNTGQILVESPDQSYLCEADGRLVTISAPSSLSRAWDLNDAGTALGVYYTGSGFHAFLWNATDGARDITPDPSFNVDIPISLNNLNQAVGWAYGVAGAPEYSFFYDGLQTHDISDMLDSSGDGWTNIRAMAINDLGQITGTGIFDGHIQAFLLTPTTPKASMPAPEPASAGILLLGGILLLRRYQRRN